MPSARGGEVRVIGAGLPRTGTLSLMTALEILLQGKCYHGMKMWQHEQEMIDIMYGNYDTDKLQHFFSNNNYIATVDAPLCFHYESAMKAFPDALVIQTVRDDAESWQRSAEIFCDYVTGCPTLYFEWFGRRLPGYLNTFGPTDDLRDVTPKQRDACYNNPDAFAEMFVAMAQVDTGVEFYNKWNEEVTAKVPKEKLLRFNVKDGWEPLCRFLGLPVPDIPFPRMNFSGDFKRRLLLNKRRNWLVLYQVLSLPLLLSLLACKKYDVQVNDILSWVMSWISRR